MSGSSSQDPALLASSHPSAAMDGTKFAEELKHWSVAGRPTSDNSWVPVCRLAEVTKAFMWVKAKALVASAARRPLLMTFGSDGTPIRATKTCVAIVCGERVVRKGGEGTELLVQRGYIVTHDAFGRLVSAPLVRDPIPLSEGKKVVNIFRAATAFFPHIRQLCHTDIVISHGCFGRGIQSAMGRLLAQRQASFYKLKYGEKRGQGPALLEELCDWYLTTGCAAHDSQNALKWGMTSCDLDASEALKGIYIAIESLRNSYSLLFSSLSEFLRYKVTFAGHELPTEEELLTMWIDLGVKCALAKEMAALGLLYQGGTVWVRWGIGRVRRGS